MTQQLCKAMVKVLDGQLAGTVRGQIAVHFNPTEYAIEYSANYQETAVPGLSSPILQFVNGAAEVLTMDLLFDTYTDGGGRDVSEDTRRFTNLVGVDADTHAPPRVEFEWGSTTFRAVVEKVSQRFTMFLGDGRPVRATLSVTFKRYRKVSEQLRNPRRNSSDKTKHRVLGKVDGFRPTAATLWQLAAQEYGDPRFWREIARHNQIEDLRALRPGDTVLVPPLPDLASQEAASGNR